MLHHMVRSSEVGDFCREGILCPDEEENFNGIPSYQGDSPDYLSAKNGPIPWGDDRRKATKSHSLNGIQDSDDMRATVYERNSCFYRRIQRQRLWASSLTTSESERSDRQSAPRSSCTLGFKATSTEALCVVSGIMSLLVDVTKRAVMYWMRIINHNEFRISWGFQSLPREKSTKSQCDNANGNERLLSKGEDCTTSSKTSNFAGSTSTLVIANAGARITPKPTQHR